MENAEINMNASKLNEAFGHVRRTFFPQWDPHGEWIIKAVSGAPFDGCAIPMTRSISINSDLLYSEDLHGVIIHEICHALTSHRHDGQWRQHMQCAARQARELGRNSLAAFLENDI